MGKKSMECRKFMVFPRKIFFAFIGCVLLFGTSTAWGCTTNEDCGYPSLYSFCRTVNGNNYCITQTCNSYSDCPDGYGCMTDGYCHKITLPSTCFTGTCTTDAECVAQGLGYNTCTNGCCKRGSGTSGGICTTCTCTKDGDCGTKCSAFDDISTYAKCINGYCYGTGNFTQYISLAYCQAQANCPAGTSCQQISTRNYGCLPYCDTGNFYTGGADCGCQSCSAHVTEAYADAYLTAFATATTAAGGHDPITSCYIPAGTYYDERGTFSYSSDCYYTE